MLVFTLVALPNECVMQGRIQLFLLFTYSGCILTTKSTGLQELPSAKPFLLSLRTFPFVLGWPIRME